MARTFDGANDSIHCSIGALSGFAFGTFVAVIRRNSTAWNNILTLHTSGGTAVSGMEIEDSADGQNLTWQFSGGVKQSSFTVVNADGWVLVAAGKDTGTVVPRFHKYVYATDTWTHQNDAAGSSAANNSTPGASATARFGEWEGVDDFGGDIAVAGVWLRNLSDAEIEQLAHSLQGWCAAAPDALWVLDQAATSQSLLDLTGGGANQSAITGTSVSTNSAPVSYGDEVLVPHSVPAAGGGTNANAENAVATGTAETPSVTVAPAPPEAAATATANAPQASVAPTADQAAATATANDGTPAVSPSAESAAATGTANNATTSVSAPAECATATATALDATVSTGSNTSASAECATAAAAAQDPTVSVAVSAESAPAAATAHDATVQTGSATNAAAECATAAATAADPSVAVRASAEHAAATGAVDSAAPSVAASAALAAATAIVEQAALAIAAGLEVAPAIGTAYPAVADTGVVIVGAGPRITASTPVGRITASTPPRMTTSTGGGRL